MKRIKAIIGLCVLCLMAVTTGCNTTIANADDKVTIVCTNFPLYDWTREILGDSSAEVILLLDNGTDMHSFQPSAEELIQIADCDLLVHVGGESDVWLQDALEVNSNDTRVVVNLTEVLKADLKEETYTEGMQTEHTHEDGSVHAAGHTHEGGSVQTAEDDITEETDQSIAHEGEHIDGEAGHHNAVMDEHVWLSLRMAMKSCEAIEEALCQVLPDEAEAIRANSKAYYEKLATLDTMYAEAVNSAEQDTIIVADRFPFMYLMEDYGIEYYAAFPGCSTESEADFETVVFLAEKLKECETEVILITESGTDVLAKTVMENGNVAGKEVLVLHSQQVVYNSDVETGATYLGYMEANLEVLKQALDCAE